MGRFKEYLAEAEDPYLYKWVNGKQFQKYLDKGKLPVKRNYAHYIGDRFVPGNSFASIHHVDKWKGEGSNDTLVRVDKSKLSNPIHHIPGHKTYLRTMGMTSSIHDPNAWEHESDKKDEHWIEGTVDLKSANVTVVKR